MEQVYSDNPGAGPGLQNLSTAQIWTLKQLLFLAIAQFAITMNSNVCPHIRVPNMLMRESYADVIGIFNSEARFKF